MRLCGRRDAPPPSSLRVNLVSLLRKLAGFFFLRANKSQPSRPVFHGVRKVGYETDGPLPAKVVMAGAMVAAQLHMPILVSIR